MSLDELTREQKRAALNELRQALFQHELWCENFNRTMICDQAPTIGTSKRTPIADGPSENGFMRAARISLVRIQVFPKFSPPMNSFIAMRE